MALALGLGSLFKHSDNPNTLYILEPTTDCMRYTTARDIQPDEELCIFYGHKSSFIPVPIQDIKKEHPISQWNDITTSSFIEAANCGGLLAVDCQDDQDIKNPYLEGDPNEGIPQEELPFTKLKPPPDEEDSKSIRTINAWAVDVPDPRHIPSLLKWLKQASLDTPDLGHLKRIRKQKDLITFLISSCTSDDTVEPPSLPPILDSKQTANQDLALPAPYILSVPASPALTLTSLALKSAIWPTIYTPRRKDEPEAWTRGKLKWAWDAMKWTIDASIRAAEEDQLPIAAHIPSPYDPLLQNSGEQISAPFTASDSRKTRNPLRHSILNVIRKIADHHNTTQLPSTEVPTEAPKAGTNYLLTDRTVFVTHEPCIMCSMALLHSRVKEVVYLYPMPKTGGCGGCACLPALKGVNHRFGIWRWNLDESATGFCRKILKIEIDDTVDA